MSENVMNRDVVSYYEYATRKGNLPRFARNFFKVGNVGGLGGAINPTYGALVYDQVNREANAHAILKKEDWERSGFRVTTTNPTVKGYGGADPDGDNSGASTVGTIGANVDYVPSELDSIPAFLHSPFNVTADAAFRARHDDGLDIFEWLVQVNRDGHAQLLNEEILRSAEAESAVLAANNTTDAKNDTNGTGLGLETMDRMISSDAEEDAVAGAGTGHYDVYEGDVDRDTATTFDSQVVRPDGTQTTFGTDLPFQLKGVNKLIQLTEDAGADPSSSILLTRRDTREALYEELETFGRTNMDVSEAKLDYNGLSTTATHSGRDITFQVRTYRDRPIIVDKNVPSSGTGTGAFPQGDATSLGHMFSIDQRHMHLKVGFPTLYIDVDNPVIRQQFDSQALYWTCEQLYATRFNVHGKLRSILA